MLNINEIRQIANLSRLNLSAQEEVYFQQELQTVLEYFQSLQQLDTSDVPATIHSVELGWNIREDQAGECLDKKEVFCNAPQSNQDFFIVPKVVQK